MRHSIPEPSAASDRDRCLTVPGRERALLIGQGLAAMGVRFDRVLTSPYPRAAETAAIVAEAVGAVAPTEARALVHGELDPMCKALGRDASGSILLVGHEPSCGAFAASLLCPGSRDGVRLRFEFTSAKLTGRETPGWASGFVHWARALAALLEGRSWRLGRERF
jgi:phosphohistidine phosphatase SixA